MYYRWSKEEEQFLIDNYQSMSNRELALELDIKQKTVENKLFKLGLKRIGKDKSTRYKVGGGVYSNLSGIVFGLICEKFIERRYPYIFILRYYQRERSDICYSHPQLPRTDIGKIGFACENFDILYDLVKHVIHSGLIKDIQDSYQYLYKPKYEFCGMLSNKERKELKELDRGINDYRFSEKEKILENEMSNKTKITLQYARKYIDMKTSYEITTIPDYVVISKDGVHIYEFKASENVKLNQKQTEDFQKLKNSGLDVDISIVRPDSVFPPDINLKIKKY